MKPAKIIETVRLLLAIVTLAGMSGCVALLLHAAGAPIEPVRGRRAPRPPTGRRPRWTARCRTRCGMVHRA